MSARASEREGRVPDEARTGLSTPEASELTQVAEPGAPPGQARSRAPGSHGMRGKRPVVDLPPAELAALSALEGDQAEQKFEAHRAAKARRSKAGSDRIHRPACTPARGSLPSGPTPRYRDVALGLALFVPSAIVLGIAFGGYLAITGAQAAWAHITRRGD